MFYDIKVLAHVTLYTCNMCINSPTYAGDGSVSSAGFCAFDLRVSVTFRK